MTWQAIRLELARTEDFPEGSVSRAYLLRLPLHEGGMIDEEALRAAPACASVRRFWPNEADLSGYVIRTPKGWAFSYEPGEGDDEQIFHLETHRIGLGEYLTVTEPDGRALPFRVASVKEIASVAATPAPPPSPDQPQRRSATLRRGLPH